jgi:acetyltransferase
MMTTALAVVPVPTGRRAPYPSHLAETARLRDGRPITVRPIRAADLLLEREFVIGLSATTRYQRLLSGRKLMPGELKRLTDIDYDRELALVAILDVEGRQQILGVARYVRDDAHEPGSADFAIVVGDAWQGQGLGEMLLKALMRAAPGHGLSALTGITLAENHRMIGLARKLGIRTRRDADDATLVDLRWAVHDDDHAAPEQAHTAFLPDAEALWGVRLY